jgi:hypothetical protein
MTVITKYCNHCDFFHTQVMNACEKEPDQPIYKMKKCPLGLWKKEGKQFIHLVEQP